MAAATYASDTSTITPLAWCGVWVPRLAMVGPFTYVVAAALR
jgi:hypothetical protein